MQGYSSFLIIIFSLFLQTSLSLGGVSTYITFDALALNMEIIHAHLEDQGQQIYLSVIDSDGKPKIKTYEILNYTFVENDTLIQDPPCDIQPTQITIFSNNQLTALETHNQNFIVFDLNLMNFTGVFTLGEEVTQFVQATGMDVIFYSTLNGNVYWIDRENFANENMSNVRGNEVLEGLLGEPKVYLSPDEDFLAIGCQMQNKVYLVNTSSKTVQFIYTLASIDTMTIIWHSNGSYLYALAGQLGLIYSLDPFQPYTITTYSYATPGAEIPFHMEFYPANDQILIWGLRTSLGVSITSFDLNTLQVSGTLGYVSENNTIGRSFDRQGGDLYAEWTSDQLTIKILCHDGYYFDNCLQRCNFCSASCTSCTTLGCGNICSGGGVGGGSGGGPPSVTPSNPATPTPPPTPPTPVTPTIPIPVTPNLPSVTPTNPSITIPSPAASPHSVFQSLLSGTVNSKFIRLLNQVPASRYIMKPIFTFFGNLDDLWLYNYHPRNYEYIVTQTFESIQQLQNEKWQVLPYEHIWDFIGLNITSFKTFFSKKAPVTSEKFLSVEGNSNGFIINMTNFLFSNMLLTLATFLTLRLLFFSLFHHKLSVFLRQYSFRPFLIVILMEGNLQYASYLFAFQLQEMFSYTFADKFLMCLIVILFFCVFLFSIAGYLLFQSIYAGLSRYLFNNLTSGNLSAIYMTVQYGFRNILLGFVHYIDFQSYTQKICVLITIQIVFSVLSIYMVTMKQIFQHKINVWINLGGSFLRLIVIYVFLLQQNVLVPKSITDTTQIFAGLIISYLILGICAVAVEIMKLTLNIISFFSQKTQRRLTVNDQIKEIKFKTNDEITNLDIAKQHTSKSIRVSQTICDPQKSNTQLPTHSIFLVQEKCSESFINSIKLDESQWYEQKLNKTNVPEPLRKPKTTIRLRSKPKQKPLLSQNNVLKRPKTKLRLPLAKTLQQLNIKLQSLHSIDILD